jgi:hypothetical protein
MRCPLFAAVSAVAVPTAAASVRAAAQHYPYCLQGRDWGYPGLCHYWSYERCMESASGTSAYCGINPRFAFPRRQQGPWRPY